MKSIIASIAVAGLMMTATANAAEMPALAKKLNCTACHAIDKKVVGPAWQDVANKYKGDAAAAERLQVKVSKGGSGNWGTMPMPPNDAAGTKQAEIKELVAFVLGLAK
ncbi:MAG: c-type cytochrome [Gallionella sp.]